MRTRQLFIQLTLLAALALWPTRAWAEPSPEVIARAEAAFSEGKRLMAAGELVAACAKFEESQSAAPGSGTLLNLADCNERIGKTATAWATFRAAAALSRAKGKAERAEEASARAQALESRLSRLRITVPSDAGLDGLVVYRNDTQVSEPAFGNAIPVDPGTVIVVAEAPGHLSWSTSLTVHARPGVSEVTVPRLMPDPNAPIDLAVNAVDPTQLVVGSIVTGLGGAAIVVGAVFGALALDENAASEDGGHCNADNVCTSEGIEMRDTALRNAHISTATLIGGSVIAAAGLVLIFTAPSTREGARTDWRLRALPTLAGGVLSLGGAF